MISKYVLVDHLDRESDLEYDTFDEAYTEAEYLNDGGILQYAIIERQYTYNDSELVWTPDDSGTWPPKAQN